MFLLSKEREFGNIGIDNVYKKGDNILLYPIF